MAGTSLDQTNLGFHQKGGRSEWRQAALTLLCFAGIALLRHCWLEGGNGHVRRNVGGLEGLREAPG